MKARHKKAAGGPATGKDVKDSAPSEVYAGKGSNVEKEAREKKHGGKVARKAGGKVEGAPSKMRLDRPGRKRGGRVGADRAPLSSAASLTNRPGGKMDSENE